MALKAVLTTLDGLPADVKKEYVQKDGKFVLDVEKTDGMELANTAGLTSALEKERQNARTAGDALKLFGDIKPEEARDAIAKVKEFAGLDVDGKVKAGIKAREDQLIKQHDTEKAVLTGKIDRFAKGLHQQLVVNTASNAILEVDPKASIPLLLPHILKHMRVREDGENFIAEVVDANGTPRIGGTKDGVSVPMTPKQLVEEFRMNPQYAPAFSAGKSSGSGADGNNKQNNNSNGVDLSKLNPIERMKLARAKKT